MRTILKKIRDILEEDEDDKIIVVSQFTSFLNIIARHLRTIPDVSYKMFTGEVPVKFRQVSLFPDTSKLNAIKTLRKHFA